MSKTTKQILILIVLVAIGIGVYFFFIWKHKKEENTINQQHATLDKLGASSTDIKILSTDEKLKLLNR